MPDCSATPSATRGDFVVRRTPVCDGYNPYKEATTLFPRQEFFPLLHQIIARNRRLLRPSGLITLTRPPSSTVDELMAGHEMKLGDVVAF
ncbi:unnamed protein product [Linum trigynum]|uniref:Uncharacterized protein n=1 Tax=Linum trigynum TaxID=586398 RepID=A0AAV2FIN5_9ROSI